MKPATYNLLEGVIRATIKIAESTLGEEDVAELRADLTGKLTSVKVGMQRDADENIVQGTARAVLALAHHTTHRSVDVEGKNVEKKHLLTVVRYLEQRSEARYETTEAALHPTGRCTCVGEGTCVWCREHCIECGMELDMDGDCENCTPDGEALAREVVPKDESCPEYGEARMYCTCDEHTPCGLCGVTRRKHEEAEESTHRWVDPKDVVEKAPEEAVIDEYVDAGLDSTKWRLINDEAGNPSVALYFNGSKDSLSKEQREELEVEAIRSITQRWGR